MTPLGCGPIAWDDVPIADDPIHTTIVVPNPVMEWQVPGCGEDGPMGRPTYRPELKRFELQSGVQIPPLREALAHPLSAPGHGGVYWEWCGADRIHRGNSTPKVARLLQNRSTGTLPLSACAHSPAPSAVRGATNAQPTEGYRCPLHSSRARGGASRLCRTGSHLRLCAVVRTRVRPSSGGTALNRNSGRSHAMLTSKV